MSEKVYRIVKKGSKKQVAEVNAHTSEQALYQHTIDQTKERVKLLSPQDKRKIREQILQSVQGQFNAIRKDDNENPSEFIQEGGK